MNFIDAIEGTVKSIIDHLHGMYIEERLDDSEYIRCVKTIITAAESYVNSQKEIAAEPNSIKNGLYAYSKELWLKYQTADQTVPDPVIVTQPNDEYQDYYYDYIYSHGLYPR